MAVCFVHQLNTRCLLLQNEARKLNHQEVVEEDKRLKLPSNWEAKKARLEWELADNEKRKVGVYITLHILYKTIARSCPYIQMSAIVDDSAGSAELLSIVYAFQHDSRWRIRSCL